MKARQFFAEGKRLSKRAQELLDRNLFEQHQKAVQKLDIWMVTRDQMETEQQKKQTTNTKYKKDDLVRCRGLLGRIQSVHRDGTYDIHYNNGQRDIYVRQQQIQKRSSGKRFQVNDRVMANFRGGRTYPGKISYVHRDGTYSIEYDDGDFEQNVQISRIRRCSADISPLISPDVSPPRTPPILTRRTKNPSGSPIVRNPPARFQHQQQQEQESSCSIM